MFLSINQKNNVYPCKPQFYNIKVGFKGVKIIQACFRDVDINIWKINPKRKAKTQISVKKVSLAYSGVLNNFDVGIHSTS